MNEEEFSVEELTQAIKDYMNRTDSVEDIIKEKKEERELSNKSFECVWDGYKTVNNSVRTEIFVFKKAALKVALLATYTSIMKSISRGNASDELFGLYSNICSRIDELKSEKELLTLIKIAVKELEKYNAYECNYDITMLLAMLNDKNSLMYDILSEDINSLAIRMKGISYMTNNNKRKELHDLNESIDYKVKELKLKQSY